MSQAITTRMRDQCFSFVIICARAHPPPPFFFLGLFGDSCSIYMNANDPERLTENGLVAKFKKKTARLRRSHSSSQHTQVTSIENPKDKHNAVTFNTKQKAKHNDGVSVDKKRKKGHESLQEVNKLQAFAKKARFLASSATVIKSRQEQSHAMDRNSKGGAQALDKLDLARGGVARAQETMNTGTEDGAQALEKLVLATSKIARAQNAMKTEGKSVAVPEEVEELIVATSVVKREREDALPPPLPVLGPSAFPYHMASYVRYLSPANLFVFYVYWYFDFALTRVSLLFVVCEQCSLPIV